MNKKSHRAAPPLQIVAVALFVIISGLFFYSTKKRLTQESSTQISNWKTYTTTLFSFKYPPEMTAGPGHTKNNIQVWWGPTNTKTKEYYFELKDRDLKQNRDLYSHIGQLINVPIDNKPAYTRKLILNLKGYPTNNITQIAVEKIRFYKDGEWFNDGVLYLVIYIDGDQTAANKTSENIIKSIKFTDNIGSDEQLNLKIKNLSFILPATSWYKCSKNGQGNEVCSINTITNAQPETISTNFLLEFFSQNSYNSSIEKKTEEIIPFLTDVKKSTATIASTKAIIIEGKTTTNRDIEMTLWPYERNIIYKSVIIERMDGIYQLSGSINTPQLRQNFDQILSTLKFLEINSEGLINAVDVYDSSKLSEHERELLSNFSWLPLKPFSSDDTEREVYLVDCQTTNEPPWEKLTGIPEKVPNTPNIAEVTLKKLVEKHYGGFPDSKEIANYEKVSGIKYKNKDSGINGVLLKEDGALVINFYDSVSAYGGGSARVSCMNFATSLTARQFPGIRSIIMCIDKYPSEENDNCFYDFQP